ncbi:type II and III secretion system protein family protein [uncultured Caulobacter sp.]|uniref:type II and III secretion system protein family protein n=1 Tax=uncultured Caulobacter sp. TaxID=158749 RepID=UPI002605D01C|nr:type II and III secretion system protein family protein [uncultured Caulobacter sp.]
MSFKRRLLTAHAAALLAMSSSAPAFADGPVGGSHLYRPPARAVRAAPPPPAPAPVTYAPSAGEQVARVTLTADQDTATLELAKGKSAIVELPSEVRDLLVTNPQTADAVLRDKRRIYIVALAEGTTDAAFFDAAGRRILTLNIRVTQPVDQLAATLGRIMPEAKITVSPVRDSVVLSGLVRNAAESESAARVAAQFVGSPDKVLNMLSVAGKDQVMLQVRIVEVQRNVIKQLGVNLNAVLGQLGSDQFTLGFSPTYGVNGGLLGGINGGYKLDTTSQPTNPIPSLFGAIPGANSGVSLLNYLQRFLASDSSLTSAQRGYLGSYVNSVAGRTTAVIPSGNSTITYTMNDVGISAAPLPSAVQSYLQNGSVTGGNAAANLWMQNFMSNLNSVTPGTGFYQDKGNPLANVTNNLAGSDGVNSAKGMLQAFERVGLVRTLAEPNLAAVSGEAGHFLVGGEFPVPTGSDLSGKVTLEFKPYGVGLGYTPVVMSGGRISLKVSTEVSELTSVGAFSLAAGPNATLTVPGLSVRRAETTVELPSGGSFMIAGLLQQTTKEMIDAVPGMTSMPILGALFRSRDFLNNQTELVIIITPYIIDPTKPQNLQTPADGLRFADDMSTVLLGRLNKVVKAPAGANAGRAYQGPVGYVIE